MSLVTCMGTLSLQLHFGHLSLPVIASLEQSTDFHRVFHQTTSSHPVCTISLHRLPASQHLLSLTHRPHDLLPFARPPLRLLCDSHIHSHFYLALRQLTSTIKDLHPSPQNPHKRATMPVPWNAENDQRLLLLIIDSVKCDYEALAGAWKKKYGTSSTYS